ncbi:MAG: hypothetical protein R3C31_10115 [Hyphomonadaceae bacterium]
MDRMVLGLLAGAVVGAPIITIATAIIAGSSRPDVGQFAVTTLLVFAALVLAMPLTQAPLWFVLRMRLRDSAASTLAGGLAFLAPSILILVAWGNYVGYAPVAQNAAWVASWGLAGLVAGSVGWRVASFEVS